MIRKILLILFLGSSLAKAQMVLIPMDLNQTDHLKAYGIAYSTLKKGVRVEWLLNYRGGSFLIQADPSVARQCRIRGVFYETPSGTETAAIYQQIEQENMEVILLEKAPEIAIYTPPNTQPWDDAVTLALEYAEIPYETLWDEAVLEGALDRFDWLHLHHEDFTGQYGKFFASYRNATWYIQQQQFFESEAKRLGFQKVSKLKLAVVQTIQTYVARGGFLFAMCSAADSYDIALAAQNTDICDAVFDGDPIDPDYKGKLDYPQCFAFKDFKLYTNPMVYEYSDIDVTPLDRSGVRTGQDDYFSLFEFSAKYDPVPTMLTQNHVAIVHNFMGQTTGFHRDKIKDSVVIMGENAGTDEVKYIHGNVGKGTFTFLGGHDPEDYQHFVGDPPTDLALQKNSPGYRLILNNILFPAAKKKKQKT
ncbi:asparagine synthetase B [candidate division KSB1 bacterium]|nr:asparagine synthetase B [candidate division KSB1 bacterium]